MVEAEEEEYNTEVGYLSPIESKTAYILVASRKRWNYHPKFRARNSYPLSLWGIISFITYKRALNKGSIKKNIQKQMTEIYLGAEEPQLNIPDKTEDKSKLNRLDIILNTKKIL